MLDLAMLIMIGQPTFAIMLCGTLGSDGHKGTDFALRSISVMARGVAVLAAAEGYVTAVRDEMPDVTVEQVVSNRLRDVNAAMAWWSIMAAAGKPSIVTCVAAVCMSAWVTRSRGSADRACRSVRQYQFPASASERSPSWSDHRSFSGT